MNNITIRIEGLEELSKTIGELAKAIGKPCNASQTVLETEPQETTAQAEITETAEKKTERTAVPTASPESFTLQQLQSAAARLAEQGKGNELVNLMRQHGVDRMTKLPEEKYGAFATALRGMGARI